MDDAVLLQRVLEHDNAALTQLLQRFQQKLRGVIARIAPNDIDDVFNDFVVNLLARDMARLRAFDGTRCALSSWLCRIAINTAYDAGRKGMRHQRRDHELVDVNERTALHDMLDVEQRIMLDQLAVDLPPREREFLGLVKTDIEDSEIAQAMGISVNTVYSKKWKLVEKLRKVVDA